MPQKREVGSRWQIGGAEWEGREHIYGFWRSFVDLSTHTTSPKCKTCNCLLLGMKTWRFAWEYGGFYFKERKKRFLISPCDRRYTHRLFRFSKAAKSHDSHNALWKIALWSCRYSAFFCLLSIPARVLLSHSAFFAAAALYRPQLTP